MNDNLLRLIYSYKKSELTDQQIIAVLIGMGVVEEIAISHLDYYNNKVKNKEPMEHNDLKLNTNHLVTVDPKKSETVKENTFHNMKKLNIVQLYENLVTCAKDLKDLAAKNAGISYSATSACALVEQTLVNFPTEVTLASARNKAGLDAEEPNVNPALKYVIAESIYNALRTSQLVPAVVMCEYISESMKEDKWGYVGAKVCQICNRKSSNKMYAELGQKVQEALSAENVYEGLKKVATESEFWCSESKQVIALMEAEIKANVPKTTAVKTITCTPVTIFSPVLESNNSVTFNLYDKNYTMEGSKLIESTVSDSRYNDVVNGLKLMSYNDKANSLVYFGVNGKNLEYDLNEGKICMGEENLSDISSLDLKDRLTLSGMFNRSTVKHIDTLVKMFESRDMICQLDSFTNLHSNFNPALFLTLIAVEEGYYVNVADYGRKVNEMKFFASATETKNFIKESINYDATALLQEGLKKEQDKQATILENRQQIQERIDFLKGKRNEVVSRIETLPTNIDSKALTEALNLLECEIKDNEQLLADTYKIDYLGDNYVKVRVNNAVGTLVPGDEVWVEAAVFANTLPHTPLTVIDTKTGASMVVNKDDLAFDINPVEPQPETPAEPLANTVECPDGKCEEPEVEVAPNKDIEGEGVLLIGEEGEECEECKEGEEEVENMEEE